ncbi:MAG TPA: RNA polymerase sporulation sigma factor SigK [Firmicutes bacterium]|jgi:RNA polymerase sporulation-specific sigma factor|nr:RNA polymerase sporulation sigma factor SigK [Bacillota bacterium]HCT37131.1 RNA polymerase sporulation sigma factor SigK [Bacillota bacterium]
MDLPILAWAFASAAEGFLFLLSYVTNNTVFPLPLNEEEESALLDRMAEGDEEARYQLIERNLRLVAHIVKKFDGTGEETDDLISIGTIGLIKGIATYKRNRNTRLATYAAKCIENEILMHLRMIKKNRNEQYFFDPINSDNDGNEMVVMDTLGTDPDAVSEKVETALEEEKLREKMHTLGRREKKVLELRYGMNDGVRKTQREISKLLGISRSYVSRIEKKALRKLYKEMLQEGYQ